MVIATEVNLTVRQSGLTNTHRYYPIEATTVGRFFVPCVKPVSRSLRSACCWDRRNSDDEHAEAHVWHLEPESGVTA